MERVHLNPYWRQRLEETTNIAGMAALGGMGFLFLNRFVRLPPRLTGLVGIITSGAGLTSTFGNFVIYADKIKSGDNRWQNYAHAAGSLVAEVSIITGCVTMLRRVRPSVAVSLLAVASFATDIVELIASATEMPEGEKEGRKSWWEFGVQCGLVFFFNLSKHNRYEMKRGIHAFFAPESIMLKSSDPVQQAVFDEGVPLIDSARSFTPGVREKFVDTVVGLTLRDPKLRSRLLRFTCALPQVEQDPKKVVQLARDFFLDISGRFPLWMRPLLHIGLAEKTTRLVAERYIAHVLQFAPRAMATHFLGGISDEQLYSIIQRLKRDKIDVTVDNLGEFVTSEEGADRYYEKCKRIIGVLDRGSSVSLKMTGLTPHCNPFAPDFFLDPANPLRRRFKDLLSRCQEKDLIAFVDAEHHEMNPLLYRLQRAVLDEMPAYREGGFVLQCYQKESYAMLDEICEWARVRGDRHGLHGDNKQNAYVRLVKGAYHDQEIILAQQKGHPIPVYLKQPETDANYRRCVDRLLEMHEYVTPCIASHNVRDIVYAISKAKKMGILHKIEIQCLFGMSTNLQKALAKRGVRVRAYVPHITQPSDDVLGDPAQGTAFLGRRLIENGSAASQKNHITWETDAGEILTLDNVSLDPRDLAGIDAMPPIYRTQFPKNGFRPTSYLNPADPREMATFWAEYYRGRQIIETTSEIPTRVEGYSEDPKRIFKSFDPSTDRPVATIQGMDEGDLEKLLVKAEGVQGKWESTAPLFRAKILKEVYQKILARRHYFTTLVMHEAGKQIQQADADIKECLDGILYAACDIEAKVKEGVFDRYAPNGVAAVIPPWNFPAAIPFMHVSMALASGSAVVLKPSELTPRIAVEIALVFKEVLRKYDLDPNTLQLLLTDSKELSKLLVADSRVKTISFTGSKAVGLDIASAAADRAVAAELGGTNAYVVANDADMDRAIAGIQYGGLGFQGYKCSHVQNVFVPEEKLPEYVAWLKEMAASTIVGSAHDPQTMVGPTFHPRTRPHLDEILGELAPGQVILDGRDRHWGKGRMGPSIVLNCERLLKEEFFGPMINVIPYKTEGDVSRRIRESRYGLTFAVQTSSPRVRAFYLKRDLETGTGVMVGNAYCEMPPVGAEVGLNPFGGPGSNLSGTGSKTGGPESMLAYMRPKKRSEMSVSLGQGMEDMPSPLEWMALAKQRGNDFRQVTPTELQYPGRTDLLERTPLGRGLIVVGERMAYDDFEDDFERLAYAYLSSGNQVRILVHRSREKAVQALVRAWIKEYGLSRDQIAVANSYSALSLVNQNPELDIDPAQFRWLHLPPGLEPPAGFLQLFRNPKQSEQQGFITRINRGPAWIDDDHFLARTQIHRVLSINTAASGDIEKVEI